MLDVIRAQLVAAQAGIVASLALLDALPNANPTVITPPAEVFTGVCQHEFRFDIPGHPGAWVCRDCSFNYPPEEVTNA